MPTEILTGNDRVASGAGPPTLRDRDDDALRKLALQHLERVRKFKLYLWGYVLAMLVLTPVWIITQYEAADGWPKHLSTRSRYPGDWDPWIIWVALIGGVLVAVAAYRAYIDRGDTEADIDREIDRLKSAH